MLRDASIICLSSVDWSFNRQNPQETALAFAQSGSRVLFIENTGVRAPALRDLTRIRARFLNWWRTRGAPRQAGQGIDLLSPLLLPLPYSLPAIAANKKILVRAIRSWLGSNTGPLIVITFLPTPLVREVIEALSPDLVVYYCIDRLAESSPAARQVVQSERQILVASDLVLVTSGLLYEEAKAAGAKRVELLASGVHVEQFEQARRLREQPLDAFDNLPGPIVGYIGSIREATDLALLARAAELAPDLQFMLAGPRFVNVKSLASLPNARLLDAIRHEDIAQYMVRFDVGILPYSINRFTAGIMPVKLKEYLAAGLPVVSTHLPEVKRFAKDHPGLVRFAGNPPDFVAALRSALSDRTTDLMASRISVARQFDWSIQMSQMKEIIERTLTEKPGDWPCCQNSSPYAQS